MFFDSQNTLDSLYSFQLEDTKSNAVGLVIWLVSNEYKDSKLFREKCASVDFPDRKRRQIPKETYSDLLR